MNEEEPYKKLLLGLLRKAQFSNFFSNFENGIKNHYVEYQVNSDETTFNVHYQQFGAELQLSTMRVQQLETLVQRLIETGKYKPAVDAPIDNIAIEQDAKNVTNDNKTNISDKQDKPNNESFINTPIVEPIELLEFKSIFTNNILIIISLLTFVAVAIIIYSSKEHSFLSYDFQNNFNLAILLLIFPITAITLKVKKIL